MTWDFNMKEILYHVDQNEIKGFYFPVEIKVDKDNIEIGDYKFQSKTLSYMLSGLNFVYSYFMYLPTYNEKHHDLLHKAEMMLVSEVGFKKDTYSIFKPGLIVDWKENEIKNFIDFIKLKSNADFIKVDESTSKVTPEYSSFGIMFESTLNSISCMFCDLLTCQYRRSPLDQKLIQEIYRREKTN